MSFQKSHFLSVKNEMSAESSLCSFHLLMSGFAKYSKGFPYNTLKDNVRSLIFFRLFFFFYLFFFFLTDSKAIKWQKKFLSEVHNLN